MAYLVLARKYRPERFSEIVGQEHITRTLANAISLDRLHHAYLFCGIRGLGKTTAARILAKCLTCEQAPTIEPCGTCRQCIGIKEGNAVDVVEIDGASNNSVDDVRKLREQVHHLPLVAKRKVYIIDEVHMMSTSAFNALLKTLEEPPPHVTFIFATTDPHKVIETILSRVSRFDFRRVHPEPMVGHLRNILSREEMAIEEEGMRMVARLSDGSVRDALTYLDKVISFAADPANISTDEVRVILGQVDRFAITELLDAVLASDAAATLARFEHIASTASNLMHVAVLILQHLRDLAVVQATGASPGQRATLLNVSTAVQTQLLEQAQRQPPARIAQLFDRFTTVVERAAQSSAPRLVIEMGLLELVHAAPMKPLGELVERLRALEQGGGARGPRETAPAGRNATGAAPNAGRPPVTKADNIEKTTPGRLADSIRRDQPKLRPQAGSSPGGAKATDDKNPYWKMLGMDPGSSQAPERQDPPPSTQPNQQEAPRGGEVPSATPRESDANFQLDGRPVTPSPHADGVRIEDDASAGCPSSRCTPKPAIPWREMEPLPVWESLVSALADEDSFAHAVFNDMGFVGLTEECLTLACPKNSFVWQQFSETPQLAQHLHRVIEERLGIPARVEYIDQAPSMPHTPTITMLTRARDEAHVQHTNALAREHTSVRALVDNFEAEVSHVRSLRGPEPS